MRRYAFVFGAVLSLVLFLAVAGLNLYHLREPLVLLWGEVDSTDRHRVGLESTREGLWLRAYWPGPPRGVDPTESRVVTSPKSGEPVPAWYPGWVDWGGNALGFSIRRGAWLSSELYDRRQCLGIEYLWAVPHWFTLVTTAVLPSVWVLGAARRRRTARRLRAGLCARCGYDLRESQDHCPECGTHAVFQPAPTTTRTSRPSSPA
jgi:hypothetical protein